MNSTVSSIGCCFCRFALGVSSCIAAVFGTEMIGLAKDVSHEVGRIKTLELVETSGLAASRLNPEVLWLHNDGGSGMLVAVSTTGKLAAMVTCRAKLNDVEDIAIGPGPREGVDYLYLADIGDNSTRRSEIRIVRFPEPDLQSERGQQLVVEEVESFRVIYPDGPHDAEAMFVDPVRQEVCIVTKDKKRTSLYCLPLKSLKTESVATLTKQATLDVDEVSAGSISRDGKYILLRREKEGWLWKRDKGESIAEALGREPQSVPVLGKKQAANGEAIGFSARGDCYFTVSEGKKEAIYQFELPK